MCSSFDINMVDEDGATYLIDEDGATYLMGASDSGHLDLTKYLLGRGALISQKPFSFSSPSQAFVDDENRKLYTFNNNQSCIH